MVGVLVPRPAHSTGAWRLLLDDDLAAFRARLLARYAGERHAVDAGWLAAEAALLTTQSLNVWVLADPPPRVG